MTSEGVNVDMIYRVPYGLTGSHIQKSHTRSQLNAHVFDLLWQKFCSIHHKVIIVVLVIKGNCTTALE